MPKGTLRSCYSCIGLDISKRGKGKIGGEKAHVGGEFTANWDVGQLRKEEDRGRHYHRGTSKPANV